MATIDDIISRAQQVRDNTAIGSNTATLVGGVMTDTAEHVADLEEQNPPEVGDGKPAVDLDVADENGNVIMRLAGGDIFTKNFDSSVSSPIEGGGHNAQDLNLADADGNVIVSFANGGIYTKNFSSDSISPSRMAEIAQEKVNDTWLKGAKVAIIGDSISTNGNSGVDANVPEITIHDEDVGVQLSAYLTYYDVQGGLSLGGVTFESSQIGTEVTFVPTAEDVGKSIGKPNNYNANSVIVWWEHVQNALGCSCIPVCWSGSSVTDHEQNTDTRKCSWAFHPSQIRKCGIRTPGTMDRTAPDVIICARGCNDMTHLPYTRITEGYFDSPTWDYPTTDVVEGKYGFLEGYAMMIKALRETYPFARIVVCTLHQMKRINHEHFPTNNGFNTLPQYNNAIREIADFFGCGLIEFDKDGVTFENCYPTYIDDSATIPTHPNNAGHYMMGKQAIADLKRIFAK